MQKQLDVQQLVGHLFRHEAGKMAAVLSRILGFSNLETAEDIVQETLLKALNSWKIQGIPDNPSAWLYAVAKNKAIDTLRKQKRILAEQKNILFESEWTLAPTINQFFLEKEIQDSQLRMIFACCHPAIPIESQIALILKILCGLSIHEIALGFLTTDDTIAKRVYRAKEKIIEEKIALEVPSGKDLKKRLPIVLKSLYLLFNEGYNSSNSDQLIKQDLCEEALRLSLLLSKNKITDQPSVNALIALMCFQASRFDTRLSNDGSIVLLKDQDRSKWNQALIKQGQHYLKLSAEGDEATEYHLEASIAACHALAKNLDETNWDQIVYLYELLYQENSNPLSLLNRAIAIGYRDDAQKGIDELLKLTELNNNHYYHTALGDFYSTLRNPDRAKQAYENAIQLTESKKELALLFQKLNAVAS